MLALRRRTQNAQRQLSSRKAKSGKKHGGRAGWEVRQKVGHQNRIMNQNNNILRQERWENWFLGPLRTGGISGIGKDGEGAGGLLKKQTIPPEYKLRTKDRRVMKKDALLEANKEAARKGISASPNFLRKAKNRRVEETIVVSIHKFTICSMSLRCPCTCRFRGLLSRMVLLTIHVFL